MSSNPDVIDGLFDVNTTSFDARVDDDNDSAILQAVAYQGPML